MKHKKERGGQKKAKLVKTCVLKIDILIADPVQMRHREKLAIIKRL